MAKVEVSGPFQVLARPVTLQPKDGKPPASSSPARGPVAWWKLDESSGASAADASGHAHAAQVRGPARWAPGQGRLGGAIELDGLGSYLDAGDHPGFDWRDGLTVSLWLKPRGRTNVVQTLAAKGTDTWSLTLGKDGKVTWAVRGLQPTGKDRRKAPRAESKQPLEPGRWHHVAGVYDGQRLALYVNGELQESITATGPVAVNTEPLWLGNNAAERGTYFNGWLDDARLFAGGLNDGEIKALYRGSAK